MLAHIQKWGNSLALRIPKPLAVELGLERNSVVTIMLEEGRLVLVPVAKPALTLEQLLAQVTPDNLYGEWDTGEAVGKELW